MDPSYLHTWHMKVTQCQSRWAQGLGSGCHCGVESVEVDQASLRRGREAGTDRSPRYTFSALVINGWRRLDLSTSTGDSRLPQPLRYLALGGVCEGLVFAGGVSRSPSKVHRGPLQWDPCLDVWEEVGSWIT